MLTPVLLWLLAAPRSVWSSVPASLALELERLLDSRPLAAPLRAELSLLRSQVEFLLGLSQGVVPDAARAAPTGV